MVELVADCPRCNTMQHTFMVRNLWPTGTSYQWKRHFEAYCVCKHCLKGTIFHLSQSNIDDRDLFNDPEKIYAYKGSINHLMNVDDFVSVRNFAPQPTPQHVPNDIAIIFQEGAQSVAGNCPNAAATMFRLCIDLVTKSLLPHENLEGLNSDVRNKLYNRLEWLFRKNLLSPSLQELAECIREDGNDGAHDGTIKLRDVNDLLDFTVMLLECVYTTPFRLQEAKARRIARKG